MYLVWFAVVSLIAFCDAAHVSKRDEGCAELAECIAPLTGYELSTFGNVGAFSDDDELASVCQKADDAQSCADDKKDECQDPSLLSTVQSQIGVVAYICSDEGREAVSSLDESPCATDPQVLLSAQEGMGFCVERFQLEFQLAMFQAMTSEGGMESFNLCTYVDQLGGCIMDELSNKCGSSFGTLARKLWQIASASQFEQFGCSMQAREIRNLKTKILPFVMAAVKRRR